MVWHFTIGSAVWKQQTQTFQFVQKLSIFYTKHAVVGGLCEYVKPI